MVLSLSKGANLSLTKTAPGLTKARVGLGWDARATTGVDFDLDAIAILVDTNGKCEERDFIFYNQKVSENGSVEHLGDNRTGAGDGDDEVINVDLSAVPANIAEIVFVVSIHEADTRGQNFGQVRNAYIHLANDETNEEAVRYDLSEDAGTETALKFARLYRHNGEWKFQAVGAGYASGLVGLASEYGIVFS